MIKTAGVDEVGRGPLAGPVVAAAVILEKPIEGLTDSKKLSEKKRQQLDEQIRAQALCFAIAEASVAEIDEINILHASMLAMRRAVLALPVEPAEVLVDGNRCPDVPYPCTAIVGGDLTEACISAASIIAKVYRDRLMVDLHSCYPDYGFDRHKGYGTQLHINALTRLGPCPAHRHSFAPVAKHRR